MKYKRFLSTVVGASKTSTIAEKLELPSFINKKSADDFFLMMSEWDKAKILFESGAFSEAKQHIITAKNICVDLEGVTPLIVGTYQIKISKFENNIDSMINKITHNFT